MDLLWGAIFIFAICVGLVIYIFQLPPEKFRKPKRVAPPPPVKEIDWEAVAKRWEKQNASLTNEIEALKKERRTFSEQLADDKKVINEQIEQLAREKAWREKETQMVEKVKNTDHELKEELRKAQKTLDEEHTIKLKVDIELQEAKIAISRLKEEVRALTVKTLAMEKQSDLANTELRDLRYANKELKKQKEDVKWIAKSDYDQVVMKLKKTESELARLTRDQQTTPQVTPDKNVAKESPVVEVNPSSEISPLENLQPQTQETSTISQENVEPQVTPDVSDQKEISAVEGESPVEADPSINIQPQEDITNAAPQEMAEPQAAPSETASPDVSSVNPQAVEEISKENPEAQTDKVDGDEVK